MDAWLRGLGMPDGDALICGGCGEVLIEGRTYIHEITVTWPIVRIEDDVHVCASPAFGQTALVIMPRSDVAEMLGSV